MQAKIPKTINFIFPSFKLEMQHAEGVKIINWAALSPDTHL